MRRIGILLLAISLPGLGRSPAAFEAATKRVHDLAMQNGLSLPFKNPEIRIRKVARALELWASGRRLKTYVVGLGDRGMADKRRQGDHLTPEGRFSICTRNERSQFHLFLGLSYPGEDAAARGVKEGLITRSQQVSILRALRTGACPPWNTRLGGAVGLHGGGSGSDWTWGCVALENRDIEELWVACPLGTPVIIGRD